ncbi:MAG: wax ester/triacylglycerol synthase family O-acyltransferase [Lautropia sp.]
MSGVDTAWLRMDSASNRMMIIGIEVFESPVGAAPLRDLLRTRLLAHRRFRQRVEIDPAGAWWVEDGEPELDRHLIEHRLPAPGGDAELQALVGELASQPLDPLRPLWQMHLVSNYHGTEALVARIHHCIADGIALVAVMLSLTDASPAAAGRGDAAAAVGADAAASRDGDDAERNPWAPYLRPITAKTVRAIDLSAAAWSQSLKLIARPERLIDCAEVGSRVIRDAVEIARMPDDSATSLKGRPGMQKRVAWADPLPLDEVKAVCRVLGASVNDVLLSCVAGALRRYLAGRGEATADVEIRAMVPINLRPLERALELGNRFGLVPLTLPVGIANPFERLRELRARMEALKGGYQAVLAFGLLGAVGYAPKPVQQAILDLMARKATAVMTNVPGPQQPIRLAGTKLSRLMFWVPQSGAIGLGVSILSYDGAVQFGVIADAGLCPDPQALIAAFAPEFERLVLSLALTPRDYALDPAADPEDWEHRLFA